MKNIIVLGSTGSVGRQVLDVIAQNPDRFKAVGLSAYTNDELLARQIVSFKPDFYYLPENIKLETECRRMASLEELAAQPADIVVLAVSGIAGLGSAVAVLKRGGTLAIANKETIVCAGRHLKALEKRYGGKILPLDTEHSAIFCCLRGEEKSQISRLILTASGGALRDLPIEKLADVTADEALRHPVWKMGKKVTIDSATLFNKGLEVIEAMRLFDVTADEIDVLMHRESIIHSLVEFKDNGMKALLSVPDMKLAIDTALSYPQHGDRTVAALELSKMGSLTFSAPDYDRYPCLKIAIDAAKLGEGACIAISAADEVLVEEFIKGNISYGEIADILVKVLKEFADIGDVDLDDILGIDDNARKYTYAVIGAR